MIGEGALRIGLDVADERVRGVRVTSTRPLYPGRALVGQEIAAARELVPLLFPVCGMAHEVAFERAVAEAAGRGQDEREADDAVVLAEAAASHVFQLAIPWRDAAGAPRDLVAVREVRAAVAELRRALLVHPPAAAAIAERIASRVLPFTTNSAPLLELVEREGKSEFGATKALRAAPLDVRAIGTKLAEDATFAAFPTVGGEPRDASCFAIGGGLLARLHERRRRARAHLAALAATTERLADRRPRSRRAYAEARGEGVGAAETARGPLVHWVRVDDGKIVDLRVVAPTDWTFHPQGTLRDALLGASASPTLGRDAGWLVLALDPCVPFSIEVRDA